MSIRRGRGDVTETCTKRYIAQGKRKRSRQVVVKVTTKESHYKE